MPELPEVETVRRGLQERLTGRRLLGVSYLEWPRTLEHPPPGEWGTVITNRTIEGVRRRAKFILIDLRGDACLTVHLRMTGQVTITSASAPRGRFARVAFALDRDEELRFDDARRFGRMGLYSTAELATRLARLGPEPLGDQLDGRGFAMMLRGRKARLKPLLLDQAFLAGLGNIYVDEALHRARLHPLTMASALTVDEAEELLRHIRQLLREAIASGGTTFSSYRDAYGNAGDYFEQRRVYDREGEPCLTCGRAIVRVTVGGRGTHFCPSCQPFAQDQSLIPLPAPSRARQAAEAPGDYRGKESSGTTGVPGRGRR